MLQYLRYVLSSRHRRRCLVIAFVITSITALAQYQVNERPSCARMFTEYEKRSEYVHNMIKDFKADGAIFARLTFCEVWGFEQYSMVNDFKEWDVPLLCIDHEYTLSGVGQLKTRVQAFLETMGK